MKNQKFGPLSPPVSGVIFEAGCLLLKLIFVLFKGVQATQSSLQSLLSAVPAPWSAGYTKQASPSSSILVLPWQSWPCGLAGNPILWCFGSILKEPQLAFGRAVWR